MSKISHEKMCYPVSGITLTRDAGASKNTPSFERGKQMNSHRTAVDVQNVAGTECHSLDQDVTHVKLLN